MEDITLYAQAYNTIQEIARTLDNEGLMGKGVDLLSNFLDELNRWVLNNKELTELQKEEFITLTDKIGDRVYFNVL